MKQDNHTIEEDILELKQRFDTDPKLLHKQDYKHLIHTVEHISSGDSSTSDKKQWRCDTQRAVSKKGKLKYTDDGFAIADKTLTGRGYFYTNEVIAIPNTDNVRGKLICNPGWKKDTAITFADIFNYFGYEKIPSDIIFILKTVRDKDGRRVRQWDGKLESLDLVILGESLHKIFVKHHSQKYVNGRRVDYIIPRSIRKDSRYTGRISRKDSLVKIFTALFAPHFEEEGIDVQLKPGVTFYYWGRPADWSHGNQRSDIGWKKMTAWCFFDYDPTGNDSSHKRNVFVPPTIRWVFYFLAGTYSHKECNKDNYSTTYVKVTVDDQQHGCMYEYKFRLGGYKQRNDDFRLDRTWMLSQFQVDDLRFYESVK